MAGLSLMKKGWTVEICLGEIISKVIEGGKGITYRGDGVVWHWFGSLLKVL